MPLRPPRIFFLVPGGADSVAALGLAERLVGRSHACDFPVEVAQLPAMTRPRIDPARPSRGLHRDMRKLVERALYVFEVAAGRLRDARPDVHVTHNQCQTCTVTHAPHDTREGKNEYIT